MSAELNIASNVTSAHKITPTCLLLVLQIIIYILNSQIIYFQFEGQLTY